MVETKNLKRTIYEKFNLHIYIFIPLIVLAIYFILNHYFDFDISKIKTLNEKLIDISLTLAGILLTILGLFMALPSTEGRKLLKRYGHNKILTKTLIIGTLALLFTTLLSALEIQTIMTYVLLIIGFVETIIASIWIYKMIEIIEN